MLPSIDLFSLFVQGQPSPNLHVAWGGRAGCGVCGSRPLPSGQQMTCKMPGSRPSPTHEQAEQRPEADNFITIRVLTIAHPRHRMCIWVFLHLASHSSLLCSVDFMGSHVHGLCSLRLFWHPTWGCRKDNRMHSGWGWLIKLGLCPHRTAHLQPLKTLLVRCLVT